MRRHHLPRLHGAKIPELRSRLRSIVSDPAISSNWEIKALMVECEDAKRMTKLAQEEIEFQRVSKNCCSMTTSLKTVPYLPQVLNTFHAVTQGFRSRFKSDVSCD